VSTIFITDIIGSGAFVVPTIDSQLVGCQYFLNVLLSGTVDSPAGLSYEICRAWVKDYGGAGGVEGARSLNCQLSGVMYNAEECPDASEIDTLTAAIGVALLHPLEPFGTITSAGVIEFTLVDYFDPV
jgi:hypothetical protein